MNFLRSVSSLGLGEQGVASRSALEGMQFNPANLVYSNAMEFSFCRNPVPYYIGITNPIIAIASTFSIPDIGYFGIEYTNWDEGEYEVSTSNNPEEFRTVSMYERSVGLGYARNLGEKFNGGVEARYVRGSFGDEATSKVFFSAGINYHSRILDKNIDAGFSLMNFGTPVEYVDGVGVDAPPSTMNLGINAFPLEDDYASLAIQLGATKPVEKQNDSGMGQSSLTSLFNDWSDFPRDITLHTGVALRWKQLDLGNGFSFGQEFYLGNTSAGVKAGLKNYFTHGVSMNIGYSDYILSLGYGSAWYNLRYDTQQSWLSPDVPPEMIQITLSAGHSPFTDIESRKRPPAGLKRIILLAGMGPSLRIGRYHELTEVYYSMAMENTFSYFLESDFYIDDAHALVARFVYNAIPVRAYTPIFGIPYTMNTKLETMSFSSLYRYHPLADLLPLYVQGGVGIIRTNPVLETTPHYYYNTTFAIGTGACFELGANVYVVPSVDFIVMLNRISDQAPGIGGYNQFDLALKLGYAFE